MSRSFALLLALVAAPLLAQGQSPAPAPSRSATPAATPVPATPASAASSAPATAINLAGAWDMVIDGTAIFRFELIRSGPGQWRGLWSRPESFNSNGDAFGNISGGVRTTASMASSAIIDMVELSFDDPRPGAVPDVFRFRQVGPDVAEMLYVGTPLRPFRLVRVAVDAPLGNWEQGRIYRRPPPAATPAPGGATPVPAEGPVMLRQPVQFLDLMRRAPPPTPAAPASPAPAATPAPTPVPTSTPTARPTPATSPAAPEQGAIGADFLDGL